jgi:DNA repair photolyase
VRARRVINEVPAASRMPFRYTINAYRGCSHSCSYCTSGDTPILMADGTTKPIRLVRVGDEIYGTEMVGRYRRFVRTTVLDHWSTVRSAHRVILEDGTELVTSADHRFLTNRGWKHVVGEGSGADYRPHLTTNNWLIGTGKFAVAPPCDADYRLGYLCGVIRGDAHIGIRGYVRPNGNPWTSHQFRLALIDLEPIQRVRGYLLDLEVDTTEFVFQKAVGAYREMRAIRAQKASSVATILDAISWPESPSISWAKGFLAGIFDAEGSYSEGILRICNTDAQIIAAIATALDRLEFDWVLEERRGHNKPVKAVRLLGGLVDVLRFFHTVEPAITRKRSIEGKALKRFRAAKLRVASIHPLGVEIPMYDITTGTGDFIANGVVSHNCFARPTHEYLGLNAGDDFEKRIVVKVNAVERLRAELASKRWKGEHIAMGTNTDPYQRCEGKYRLTRGIIEELGAARNPFSILTKGTLILRDLDVLTAAAKKTDVRASFSIGTLDERVWRTSEPGTPHPRKRVEAVAKLNEAGIPCGVLVAPILPGLSDAPEQIEEVVKAVLDAGAVSVSAIVLHLRPGVREQFMPWLESVRPDLLPRYAQLYPRSYAPKSEQEKLSRMVGSLRRKHRRNVPPTPPTSHPDTDSRKQRQPRPPASVERQLPLGL